MMLEGWTTLPLHLVAKVQKGMVKTSHHSFHDPVHMPCLSVANVQDGYFDFSAVKTVTCERKTATTYLLSDGDVLLTESGDADKLGRGTIWRAELPQCLYQNHIFAVRTQQQRLLPTFLVALVGSRYGRAYFRQCAKQSTSLATMNSSQLRAFPVLLPPLHEQQAILLLLASWDHALDLTARLIEKKQQQKLQLIQQVYSGKRRFQRFIDVPWPMHRADEIFQFYSKINNKNETLLSVTQAYGVLPHSFPHTRNIKRSKDLHRHKLVEPGSFIMSLRSFEGGVEYSSYRGLINPLYKVFMAKKPIIDGFYKHLFKSPSFIACLSQAAIGIRSGKQMRVEDFAALLLPYPSLIEQQYIAEMFDTSDRELHLLARKYLLLQQQRQEVLQALLEGRRRLKR